MKKIWLLFCIFPMLLITACNADNSNEKIRDVDYTVVVKEDIPIELTEEITTLEKEPFLITYSESDYLYIAKGFGTQPTSGYSIQVIDLYETESSLIADFKLLGPKKTETVTNMESYPYIVIKVEYISKPLIED